MPRAAMNAKLVGQRLVLLFLLGVVLLNDPVFSLFDRGQFVGGVPVIYIYLFAVWIGLICVLGATLALDRADKP